MLLHGSSLLNQPVMSLQTGTELARTIAAIVDPRNLHVLGFTLEGRLLDAPNSLLMTRDIREISNVGLIVDSSDEFVLADDIIAIKTVLDFRFSLEGIKVIDQKKHTLGKVLDYTMNPLSYQIEQLRIKRPFLKSLADTELLVGRQQIVEVQNDVIIVKSDTEKTPEPVMHTQRAFTNPFRQSQVAPQPESSSTSR